jgi:hypothetical protein
LELAKRLKELGVLQKAYWNWSQRKQMSINEGDVPYWEWYLRPGGVIGARSYCAFTASELTNSIPGKIQTERYHGEQMECLLDERAHERILEDRKTTDATEADARAKLLVYLTEKQLVSSPK